VVVAAAVALLCAAVVARVVAGSWPAIWDSLRSAGHSTYFPPLGLAMSAAITITASPHLIMPVRRISRWLLSLALVGMVFHAAATPIGAAAGTLVAAASAAAVHLIFGSSMGRPSLADVASALSRLGIDALAIRRRS
jgi:glycosyltransferase 2 family protein